MSLQYLGLDEINGPLVFLDHVEGVGYEEMVEIRCKDGSSRMGRVVQLEGSRAANQRPEPDQHQDPFQGQTDGTAAVT